MVCPAGCAAWGCCEATAMSASLYPHVARLDDGIALRAVPPGDASAPHHADIHSAGAHRECRVFHRMLLRLFPVPDGIEAEFVEQPCAHAGALDLEVCLRFDAANPAAVD